MNKLRIKQINIRNVLGIREGAVEPGKVTIFEGENASNKTGHLEAIKITLGRGNLANLARIPDNPEDEVKPEVVLIIEGDNPDEFWQVEKKSEKLRVRKRVGDTAGLEDVPKPQRWLSGLIDPELMNPIDFLNAKDNERVLLLLEALPVQFEREELWAKIGLNKKDFSPVPEGLHPITELALIREAIFRERTGVNRDQKAKAETAEQTKRSIPAVLPDGQEERIAALDKEVKEEDNEITRGIEQVKSEAESAAQEIRNEHLKWAAERRAELEQEISEAKEHCQKDIDKIEEEKDAGLEKLFELQKAVEEKNRELIQLREAQKNSIRFQTLKEQADRFEEESEELKSKANQLTKALEDLDAYRRGLLDNLPIDGLEVDDKIIKIKGVPFDMVNTAEKMKIAVKVACLRAKEQKLPILFIDGAEALDSKNFELFCEELEREPVWPLIGRVSDKPFEVRVR